MGEPSGLPPAAIEKLDIPESDLYVVCAGARYPEGTRRSMIEPSEALGLRSLRKPDAVYSGSRTGETWTELDVPVDTLPRHSSLPVL